MTFLENQFTQYQNPSLSLFPNLLNETVLLFSATPGHESHSILGPHTSSHPLFAVKISEGLWPGRAGDVLHMLTLHLGCQSRWKCLGLLMAHKEFHKNKYFLTTLISKSLETNPVTHRGDKEGEEERETNGLFFCYVMTLQ